MYRRHGICTCWRAFRPDRSASCRRTYVRVSRRLASCDQAVDTDCTYTPSVDPPTCGTANPIQDGVRLDTAPSIRCVRTVTYDTPLYQDCQAYSGNKSHLRSNTHPIGTIPVKMRKSPKKHFGGILHPPTLVRLTHTLSINSRTYSQPHTPSTPRRLYLFVRTPNPKSHHNCQYRGLLRRAGPDRYVQQPPGAHTRRIRSGQPCAALLGLP